MKNNNQLGAIIPSTVFSMVALLIIPGLSLSAISISSVVADRGVLTRATESFKDKLLTSINEDINLSVTSVYTNYQTEWIKNSEIECDSFFTVDRINDSLEFSKILIGTRTDDYGTNIIGVDNEEQKISEIADEQDGNSEKSDENEYGYELFVLPFEDENDIILGLFYLDNYIPCCVDVGLVEAEEIEIESGKIQDNNQLLEILESATWLNYK